MGNRAMHGCRRWLGALLLGLLLAALLPAQPPATLPPPKVEPTHTDLLARYRRIALHNQPALAAYRASLCVAQTKTEAVQKIGGLATLFRPDLDVRKEQVQYGVLAAQAQLSVSAWETLYAVTRNYWSLVHARELLDVAEQALDPKQDRSLYYLRDILKDAVKENPDPDPKEKVRRDLTDWHARSFELTIEIIRARKIEAEVGLRRAEAALREAMGVPPDFPIQLPSKARLPWVEVAVCRDDVLRDAVTRRGEVTQAMVFHQVTSLEVKAQEKLTGLLNLYKAETFAAGSDIHVQSVPMQQANTDYRPGGVGPEMPAMLAGKRDDRVEQARHYAGRAEAVVAKTKQLLTLQADDAFWKYEKATREAEAYRKVVAESDAVVEDAVQRFRKSLKEVIAQRLPRPDLDDVLFALLRGSQARLSWHQARYDRLLALTLLERVTAGGVTPGFDEPLPLDRPSAAGADNAPKEAGNGKEPAQP